MTESNEAAVRTPRAEASKGWFNRTVVGAGITSSLGDFCLVGYGLTPVGQVLIALAVGISFGSEFS